MNQSGSETIQQVMKIISDYRKDTQTVKPIPGSYEWWYFDAMSEDGYSIVIIFYDGNPFSRRYIEAINGPAEGVAGSFPALSISLYRDGKPLYYGFRECDPLDAEFSEDHPSGSVEQSRFSFETDENELIYRVELDQKLAGGDTIRGSLEFRSPQKELFGSDEEASERAPHKWNLIQPKCRVAGEIRIGGYSEEMISFHGIGYHDHNTGREPMKESFDEWYWGRYHLEDATLVYYLMNLDGNWEKEFWLIGDDGTVEKGESASMSEKGLSFFGLETARKIEFTGSGYSAHLQLDRLIDNGPFYQRFEGRLLFNRGEKIETARGISEYIRPERIYSRLFWPLVDMRISYPGKDHWVQKSPFLYRWTW